VLGRAAIKPRAHRAGEPREVGGHDRIGLEADARKAHAIAADVGQHRAFEANGAARLAGRRRDQARDGIQA
jgi:hypothetical protein